MWPLFSRGGFHPKGTDKQESNGTKYLFGEMQNLLLIFVITRDKEIFLIHFRVAKFQTCRKIYLFARGEFFVSLGKERK